MTAPIFPISGRAFRVAPSQGGQPVASFWKFWIEGGELYAMNRDAGSMKVSVHSSGQMHLRMERRDLQLLAPPLQLPGSDWHHALDIRYLVAPDRLRPTPKKLKKKEKAYLVEVADGRALILNLLLTATSPPPQIPTQCGRAQILWAATLSNGRRSTLVARVLPLDQENQTALERLRGADGPKVTFTGGEPVAPHLELSHVFSGPGGNVILIVPAGSEAIRTLGSPASSESDPVRRRQPEVAFNAPSGSLLLRAPNGATVGELSLEGERGHIRLSKNEQVTAKCGQFRLIRFDDNLLSGERFELPPLTLSAVPSIGGLSPREWKYSIRCSYDGTSLKVSIRQSSVGLLVEPSSTDSAIQVGEQVILTAPSPEVTLTAAPGISSVKVHLSATLLLCDVVK